MIWLTEEMRLQLKNDEGKFFSLKGISGVEPKASVLPMSYDIPPDDTKLVTYKLKYLIGLNPTCPSASARIETVTWKKPFAIK